MSQPLDLTLPASAPALQKAIRLDWTEAPIALYTLVPLPLSNLQTLAHRLGSGSWAVSSPAGYDPDFCILQVAPAYDQVGRTLADVLETHMTMENVKSIEEVGIEGSYGDVYWYPAAFVVLVEADEGGEAGLLLVYVKHETAVLYHWQEDENYDFAVDSFRFHEKDARRMMLGFTLNEMAFDELKEKYRVQ